MLIKVKNRKKNADKATRWFRNHNWLDSHDNGFVSMFRSNIQNFDLINFQKNEVNVSISKWFGNKHYDIIEKLVSSKCYTTFYPMDKYSIEKIKERFYLWFRILLRYLNRHSFHGNISGKASLLIQKPKSIYLLMQNIIHFDQNLNKNSIN